MANPDGDFLIHIAGQRTLTEDDAVILLYSSPVMRDIVICKLHPLQIKNRQSDRTGQST